MAFLTLVAPLISITYPIDKISDGKAQAFNIWLREFIFNALLQPFHLLIYTIFLGSSIEIATENPIFAILFLAFISPAEKLLRKMFGFDKSETTGGLNTAASLLGGAAVLKTAGNLAGRIGKSPSELPAGFSFRLLLQNPCCRYSQCPGADMAGDGERKGIDVRKRDVRKRRFQLFFEDLRLFVVVGVRDGDGHFACVDV